VVYWCEIAQAATRPNLPQTPHTAADLMAETAPTLSQGCTTTTTPGKSSPAKFTQDALSDPKRVCEGMFGDNQERGLGIQRG